VIAISAGCYGALGLLENLVSSRWGASASGRAARA